MATLRRDRFAPHRRFPPRGFLTWARLRFLEGPAGLWHRSVYALRAVWERKPDFWPTRRWLRKHWAWRAVKRLGLWLFVLALLALVALAIGSVASGRKTWSPVIEWGSNRKQAAGWGGDIVNMIMSAVAPLALGLAAFLV